MKAKSKVLLGLLVALAMVVMAVPAFAASTFTVPTVTPQNNGVAYVGGTAKIDVTIDTETPAEAAGDYTVTITDTTKKNNAAIADKVEFEAETVANKDIKATNLVTLESEEITNAHDSAIGEHTFEVVVQDGADGRIVYDGDVKINVKAGLTANFSGYAAVTEESTLYQLTADNKANVGDKFNLNGIVVGGEEPYTYSWQMGTAAAGASTAKKNATGWTEFSKEKNPNYVVAAADKDKFVRLVVTDAAGNEVVATGVDEINSEDADVLATIKLPTEIKNTGAITFTTPASATSVTRVVGQASTAENTTAVATGGTGELTYKWYKDGVEITDKKIAEGAVLKVVAHVTKENAGEYTCVATDQSTPAVTATSPAYTLNVVDAPAFELSSSVGTVKTAEKATWKVQKVDDADQFRFANGSGTLYLTKEQAEGDVKLTLNVEKPLDAESAIAWRGTGITPATAANKTEVTLTGPVASGKRVVGLDYPSYNLGTNPEYELDIMVTSGTLTATNGGIFKAAADGQPTVSPVYTITLPEGVTFTEDVEEDALAGYIADLPAGMTVTIQEGTGEEGSNTVSFALDNSAIDDAAYPSVKDMAIVIPDDDLNHATADVVLPVSKDIGWEITGTLENGDIKVDPNTATYTGEELPATVVKADTVTEDIGEITKVYYQKNTETKDVTKATTTTPSDAGTYYVWADVAASKAYPAAEKVEASNTYTISAITIDKNNAETYLDWVKEKEYTGDVLDAEVEFKDGFTKTGKVDKVVYKDEKGNVVQPTNKGVYTIWLTTADDGDDNKCENINKLTTSTEIGTFTITGKKPTADLYTIDPEEVKYNGAGQEPSIVADDKAGAVEAVHYYAEGSEEELEGKPTEAGVYNVKVDTKESDVYAAAKGLEIGTFTIKEDKSDEQPDIYMVGHVQNIGWGSDGKGKVEKLEAGKSIDVGTTGRSLRVEAVAIMVPEDYKVVGFAHVQNVGDAKVEKKETSKDYQIPEGYVAYEFGSTGKSQRVEAVCIGIQDADGEYVKGFQYATHLQNYGWQGYVRNGSFSGTRGMALRMESIRFTYSTDDIVKAGEPK